MGLSSNQDRTVGDASVRSVVFSTTNMLPISPNDGLVCYCSVFLMTGQVSGSFPLTREACIFISVFESGTLCSKILRCTVTSEVDFLNE